METKTIIGLVVVVLLLLFLFAPHYLTSAKDTAESKFTALTGYGSSASDAAGASTGGAATEHMSTAAGRSSLPEPVSDALYSMGYSNGVPWDEVIQATEVDPATFDSQKRFVRDVRRFSSGANFTSVEDDNNSFAFTNFVGLQRPQHVPIGASARQQPDIDQSVLQRNKQLRFN